MVVVAIWWSVFGVLGLAALVYPTIKVWRGVKELGREVKRVSRDLSRASAELEQATRKLPRSRT